MERVFLKIFNMSIAAGWLIAAVLLLRVLLKKAPKWVRCALWSLVCIRLICPFSFESVLSLLPAAETVPAEIMTAREPAIESGINSVDSLVNPVMASSLAPRPGDSVNPMQIVVFAASVLWAAGAAAMLLYALISCVRLRRQVAASVRLKENLWLCDDVKSPFIFGVFFPRIYLPSDLEEPQLSCVIAHERAHLKRRDHRWKPLGFLLLSVYWFHPLCWAAYILLCRDIESACDERVIREMGAQEKKNYAEALLSCSAPRHGISACPLAFGESGVKARVKGVLSYRKPAYFAVLAAFAVCIAAAVCFLTNPVSAEDTLYGARYTVAEVLYEAPEYNASYTPGNAPEYVLTSEGVMMQRGSGGLMGDNAVWNTVDVLTEVKWEGGSDGPDEPASTAVASSGTPGQNLSAGGNGSGIAAALKEELRKLSGDPELVLRADSDRDGGLFYLVMQMKGGDVLIAVCFGEGGEERLRFLWRTERHEVSGDTAYFAAEIASMCGKENVQVFAYYESAGMPDILIAGFTEDGGKLGYALFRRSDSLKNPGWRIRGFSSGLTGSLNIVTIGEDWGLDESVTIVPGSLRNVEYAVARVGEEEQRAGAGMNFPYMIVFEWQRLLSEDEAAAVEVRFFDGADKELNVSGEIPGNAQGGGMPDVRDSEGGREVAGEQEGNDSSVINADMIRHETQGLEEWQKEVKEAGLLEAGAGSDESALNAVISSVVLEYALSVSDLGDENGDSVLFTESHYILDSVPEGGANEGIKVYIMALYQIFELTESEELNVIDRGFFPAVLTFSAGEDGSLSLKEEWIMKRTRLPTAATDGYETELREHFPEDIAEKAIFQFTDNRSIEAHMQTCYGQAIQYWNLDADRNIERLFEVIESSPRESSEPNDYLSEHQVECIRLYYYGGYTLRYIIREFAKGGRTDLRGHLMLIILNDMLPGEWIPYRYPGETGQDHFDGWLRDAEQLQEKRGTKWMEENEPYKHLLLTVIGQGE